MPLVESLTEGRVLHSTLDVLVGSVLPKAIRVRQSRARVEA